MLICKYFDKLRSINGSLHLHREIRRRKKEGLATYSHKRELRVILHSIRLKSIWTTVVDVISITAPLGSISDHQRGKDQMLPLLVLSLVDVPPFRLVKEASWLISLGAQAAQRTWIHSSVSVSSVGFYIGAVFPPAKSRVPCLHPVTSTSFHLEGNQPLLSLSPFLFRPFLSSRFDFGRTRKRTRKLTA